MQIGSLVTPKKNLGDKWWANDVPIHLYRPLLKGEILTVCLIVDGPDINGKIVTGLCFEETGVQIHPYYKEWWDGDFDELQAPMSMPEELLCRTPETCEA